MIITLSDTSTGKGTTADEVSLSGGKQSALNNTKMYFPVNPQQISTGGDTFFQEYEILNKGTVKIPQGKEISTISWESFFPVKQLMDQPYVLKWSQPSAIHKQLEKWQTNGTKLKLNITGTPFNSWVYIDSYEQTIQDAYGNIYYKIEFSIAINASVDVVTKKKSSGKTSGNNRNSKTNSTKKYTVKKGDCLWNIAKKFYKDGTQWKKIYNANKAAIEKTAKKRGYKSSSQGHWIFPGTVLSIP